MLKADWIAGSVGGAMLFAAAAVLGVTHYSALVTHSTNQIASNSNEPQDGLKFPTIDQMCKAAGATAAYMQSCTNDETSAAEFVGAWMEFNGFLTDGRINIEQIQLQAELAAADPSINQPSGDPLDPLADPSPDGDPAQGLVAPADADPLAPPADQPMPAAQVALYCLSSAADDWLKMHDCITHNDPSSTLDGN